MAKAEFTPFSRSLNPFRGLERSVDATIINDGFGAVMAQDDDEGTSAPIQSDLAPRSLFLRVVQVDSGRRRG